MLVLWGLMVAPMALANNLTTCLDGRYPALCNYTQLTPEQLQKVRVAEHAANLKSCLDGRYFALCRHGDLNPEEMARVILAEHSANLQACLDGRYVALCRHDDLTATEIQSVREAEHKANLAACLDGRYPGLCRHDELTPEEAQRVYQAERQATQQAPLATAKVRPRHRASSTGCETGHWIDRVMDGGKLIKLEDGSLWKVDSVDVIDSALWLPISDIVMCDDKLINTDDNEAVGATRLR